jgi:hypothetical protein
VIWLFVRLAVLCWRRCQRKALFRGSEESWQGGERQDERDEREFIQEPLCKATGKVLVAKDVLADLRAGLDKSELDAEDGRLTTDDCHRIRRCLEPRPAVSLRWPLSERQHSHNAMQDESFRCSTGGI